VIASLDEVACHTWAAVGGEAGDLAGLQLGGPRRVLPSCFDVTGFATPAVAASHLGVARVVPARTGADAPAVALAGAGRRCVALSVAPRIAERPEAGLLRDAGSAALRPSPISPTSRPSAR
jgi:hypothetical protein